MPPPPFMFKEQRIKLTKLKRNEMGEVGDDDVRLSLRSDGCEEVCVSAYSARSRICRTHMKMNEARGGRAANATATMLEHLSEAEQSGGALLDECVEWVRVSDPDRH